MLLSNVPESGWRCNLMDPPWDERGAGKVVRGAQRHYPLMSAPLILDTILGSGLWHPAEHAHLYCWVTNNKLEKGLWLVNQLGFRYVTNVCWAKKRSGIGQYYRGRHELCLFAVRGRGKHESVCSDRRDLPSCIEADHVRSAEGRVIHSAKPLCFRTLFERRTHGPRVEFFARGAPAAGWTAWGNEVEAA
jgi:N6-adenosine-specific RNA methylase IME4